MSYKKGDQIKCIDTEGYSDDDLTLNKVYTVTKDQGNNSCVHITTDDGSIYAPYAWRFKPVPKANGVNIHGEPLNFTRDDLKSLMRVVLSDGAEGIIAEEGFGHYGVCVVYDTAGKAYGSFDPAHIEPYGSHPLVVEVYENPGHGNVYKQGIKGALIWKSEDAVKAAKLKEADEAVTAAKAMLAQAQAKVAEATAARAAL